MTKFRNCLCTLWKWASNYVCFTMGAPFISGLCFSEAFIDIAFKAFFISYIDVVWIPSLWKAVALAEAFEGMIFLLSIIVHHVACDRLGHFRLIIFTIPCLIMGLLMLWLSSLIVLLYIALLLLTVGLAGGDAPRSFLTDQFYGTVNNNNNNNNNVETRDEYLSKREKEEYEGIVEGRADFWAYAAKSIGTMICWTFSSSLKWKEATMVTFFEVAAAYTLFCCGICYYERKPPTGRTAASRMLQARGLLKLIPLWLIFIPYTLLGTAANSFFILQSDRLDTSINPRISLHSFNRIPVTSLYVFQSFISPIISISSNFLIRKFWSTQQTIRDRARFVKICIGMLFAFGSCLSAWLVEVRRRNLIEEYGINEQVIPMKILWLAPQFVLLGIARGLVEKGMNDFFCDRVPESMQYFAVLFNQGVQGIGCFLTVLAALLARGWIGDSMDESHLDKYFQMLAILNIAILPVSIFLFYMCDWNIADNQSDTPGGG